MPQLFRLKVSISLDKLPTRQHVFLNALSEIPDLVPEKFYVHLVTYFFLNQQKDAMKNIVGLLGELKNKTVLRFHNENIF
ncbi:hypothetical protein [Acinetobacter sp. Marseille-Q1618]|uniref:hypothetical protein n=1 Tax=Acinetobacter sp. Marseille-Q1618 TaxID=2697502 RepID=UPI001570A9E5|nr:hypothetical protein [Acinetobacter sp. Marseille-Q1618]